MPSNNTGKSKKAVKSFRVDVRLDEKDWAILEAESKKTGKNKPKILRELIKHLEK